MHFCFLRLDKSELTEKWRQTRKKSSTGEVLVGKFFSAGSIYTAITFEFSEPRTYRCDGCNVRFNRKDELTCHQSGACKGADYKKCSVCGKELRWLCYLNHHTLLHMIEKDQTKIGTLI